MAKRSVWKRLGQWTRTKRGAASLFVFIVVLGAGLIALGDVLTRWSDYNRSIFAALGTALVLIAPLALGERLLRTFLEGAKDAVDQARRSTEQVQHLANSLQGQLSNLLNLRSREHDDLAQQASEGEFGPLVSLYDEAHNYRWIYSKGIRVETGFPRCNWAKMTVERGKTGEDVVRLDLEEEPFKSIDVSVDWTPAETAAQLLDRILQRLQQVNRAPDKASFLKSELLARFAGALRKAIELHAGSGGTLGVDSIILFFGDAWALTTSGLFYLPRLTFVAQQDFKVSDREYAQKRGLGDVADDFLEAVGIAKEVYWQVRKENVVTAY